MHKKSRNHPWPVDFSAGPILIGLLFLACLLRLLLAGLGLAPLNFTSDFRPR